MLAMLTLIQINPACGISHLVAWPAVPDLFICAKHLLFAAMLPPAEGQR